VEYWRNDNYGGEKLFPACFIKSGGRGRTTLRLAINYLDETRTFQITINSVGKL